MILEIHTQDGGKFTESVENYDSEALNEQLNDMSRATVVIGNSIFHRTSIVRIVPVED